MKRRAMWFIVGFVAVIMLLPWICKAESKGVNIEQEMHNITSLDLSEPSELDLGKHLARYGEAIESAAAWPEDAVRFATR